MVSGGDTTGSGFSVTPAGNSFTINFDPGLFTLNEAIVVNVTPIGTANVTSIVTSPDSGSGASAIIVFDSGPDGFSFVATQVLS